MSKLLVNDVMAKAFAAEGVDVLFTLMGDGNMHWLAKMADAQGVRLVHARHEHSACSMAHGYAHATGKVGVASTTCGPGYTQIMTALAQAAHGRVPMVVFAGDAPIGASWYLQEIDMGPLARGSGAHYIPIRSVDRVLDGVREAFIIAASERKPVVLSVPMDLQRQPYPHLPDYQPSSEWLPAPQRPLPDPVIVDRVAEMIAQAQRPMIIAGRGAVQSGARQAIEALAERSGAILATSLMGKGLFDGTPFAMDIAGSFGSDLLHELFAEADLVIGIGAGLGYYTTEGGYLYPGARVVQIDVAPRGCWQGQRTADVHVCADARAAAEALVAALERQGVRNTGLRTPELARRIASDVPDSKEFPVQPGMVDPRHAMAELDRAVPKDWDIVIGLGSLLLDGTDQPARPRAGALPRGRRLRRDRFGLACRHRRGRCPRGSQRASDRRRRQPDAPHPGAGDGTSARHEDPGGRRQRRRLWCRGAQVPRAGHPDGSSACDARPWRPGGHRVRLRLER